MSIPRIPEGEYRFCLIMWEHEPVSSLELVKLCQEKIGLEADYYLHGHQAVG